MNAILLLAAVINVSAGTSLQDAFDRVAEFRAANPEERTIEVVFAPGEYALTEAAVLAPASGGGENGRVVYRSADPRHPAVITGGRRITGWQVGADGIWRVTLPEVREGRWNFTRLFAGGVRRFRPRFPSEGYSLTVSNILHSAKGPVEKEPGLIAGFAYEGDAIDPAWANREDLELVNLQKWNSSRMHIGSLDAASRIVRFTAPRYCTSRHSAYSGTRFWVENVKEMFGRLPGEWYLDRPTGVLSYRPCPGETPANTVVEVPVADRLLLVRGEPNRDVANVEFRDLVFTLDGHSLPFGGSFAVQAAFQVPAAVELIRAQHIDFTGCVLSRLGGYAFAFGPGAHDCRVAETLMRDLGAGGVKMGSPYKGYADLPVESPQPMGAAVEGFDGKAWDLTHHITVENCRVTGGGRIFPDGVGLLCLRASYNRFLHNELDNLYYSGINVGWDWSGLPTMSHHNEIGYNHIHRIGQRVLSDMGFIYLLGRAPGTHVHHNYLHDISCFAYGGTGIYPDEASSGVEVDHNYVHDSMRSYHQNQNGGERNYVHDNVFLNARVYQYDYNISVDTPDNIELEMRRNVFVWDYPANSVQPGTRDWTVDKTKKYAPVRFGAGLVASSNVYWRRDGEAKVFRKGRELMDLATWAKTIRTDETSVYADPLIEELPSGAIRFKPGSPAAAFGLEPLDVSLTGPTGGAPKCAVDANLRAAIPPLYSDKKTVITDGRLEVVFNDVDAGLTVTDLKTGAKWATPEGAVNKVFAAVMTTRKLAADKLRFNCVGAAIRGFANRDVAVSVRYGVLVIDIIRTAGAGYPMPTGLDDLNQVAYPYVFKPLNAAAKQQQLRVVRNAFIEVWP